MSQYFPKPFRSFRGNINVKVDLYNYATKTDLKIKHTLILWTKNKFSIKTEVDKLDIDKLAPVPVDLNKLSDAVKNDAGKKAVYDKLATKYQTDKAKLENKIPDVTNFVKKTKLTELENKIPDVSGFAAKSALTAVENKIRSFSILVKKTNYGTKISEPEKKFTDHNHEKYITLQSLIL